MHYLKVLEMIGEELEGNAVENPNVFNIVKQSFDSFLESISKSENFDENIDVMIFPTNSKTPKLVESQELVFDDWPALSAVLEDQKFQFVQRNDKFKQKYQFIPDKWRPKRLSEMYKMGVSIEKSPECTDPDCEQFTDLKKRISSQHFSEALIRLIRHHQGKFDLPEMKKDQFAELYKFFKGLKIQCYRSITTEVKDKVSDISMDTKFETKKSVLKSKIPLTMGLEHDMLTSELEDSASPEEHVWKVILEMLDHKYSEKDYQWEILEKCVCKLLKSNPEIMRDVLDRENIESMENLAEDKYNHLGEIIPEDVVSILEHDPFLPIMNKRMVAYNTEEDVFIYAQIEECAGDENPSSFVKIDIGDGEIKSVQLLDILFFPLCRKVSRTVAVFEGIVSSEENEAMEDSEEKEPFMTNDDKFRKDLKAIFDDVSRQLEENYSLLKDDQKAWPRFVRRMLFKWHPDKNPEFQEKATEVVKFIKNEVERIEKGLNWGQNIQSKNNTQSDFSNFRRDFWRDFFRNCDDTARDQRYQRQNYYQNYQRYRTKDNSESYNDFQWNVPPSFETNNLGAARMWLEIAKSDLKAAKDNLNSGNHRVAAYMCRMVIEMCVKSVELTCTRTFTKTHDIRSIIGKLPNMEGIKEDLQVAWVDNVPNIMNNYSDILYKSLNRYTGEDPREFFKQHEDQIQEGINVAQRDFVSICEDHLIKFENTV